MFARPKKTDSLDDILEMQKSFLAEKAKNSTSFKPAAKVVKMDHEKKTSLYAQKRKLENEKKMKHDVSIILGDVVENPRKVEKASSSKINKNLGFPEVQKLQIMEATKGKSLFATSMEKELKKCELNRTEEATNQSLDENNRAPEKCKFNFGQTSALVEGSEMGQSIHDENITVLSGMSSEEILNERTKLMTSLDPKIIDFLKKRKKTSNYETDTTIPMDTDLCLATHQNLNELNNPENDSTTSLDLGIDSSESDNILVPKFKRNKYSSSSVEIAHDTAAENRRRAGSDRTVSSSIGRNMSMLIDNHASEFNKSSTDKQITNLINTYDKLISKKTSENETASGVSINIDYSVLESNNSNQKNELSAVKKIDNDTITSKKSKKKSNTVEVQPNSFALKNFPVVSEILGNNQSEKWVNFNMIETEKLEWMKDVKNYENLEPGQKYEARFDWKGVLLPYKEEIEQDNRELYLHGDESFRPGYTLQELFRLSRSNVMQQRVAALTAIGGILNIYSQGFYDSVLEIPITKIFFLLRFGLDENTLAIVEVVANSLSALFYNETDEIILDLIADTSLGFLQPSLEVNDTETNHSDDDDDDIKNIEKNLNKMVIASPFTVNVPDQDEALNRTTMSDLELAETDLIDCLLRTNILQRIFFIFRTLKPENSTISSCVKILIRIARTNKDNCLKITSHPNLLNTLFHYFLPSLNAIDPKKTDNNVYNYPQYLVLKLFRILMSHHSSICIQLLSKGLLERIKNYLHNKNDIKAHAIKLQIESLRILRVIMIFQPDFSMYKDFVPIFRYLLEWHYQNLIYSDGSPILIKQHASALLNAISSGPYNKARKTICETLIMCFSKWFHEAKKHGIKEFSQSILLSACLNCVSWGTQTGDNVYFEFIEKYLKTFINDAKFIEYIKNLSCSSVLLKSCKDRRNAFPSLPNLGTILTDVNNQPQLILSQLYPIYLLNDLFKLSEILLNESNNMILISFIQIEIIEILTEYMRKISLKVNKILGTNFVAKSEIKLICKLICFNGFDSILTKAELLQATFNLLTCMTSEHVLEISKIFDCVIFNASNLEFETNILKKWKDIYLATFVYPHKIVISPADASLVMPYFPQPILPIDWPYMLLKSVLDKYLHPKEYDDPELSEFTESQIIEISFTFTHLLRKDINIITPTEELMYYMISFMSKESDFLQPKLKALLKEQIMYFFNAYKNYKFDFDGRFEGKSKFENLYILFLDHFQAASYGDDLFSALVMIPLAQKYDPKWRKKVWSEHSAVLRFIKCDDNQLLGSLNAYLEPIEKDISLIKCYARAINSDLLRENSIPYKIATHHVSMYKKN